MDKDRLVPVEKVLDDMYSDSSDISNAARDYYYVHYANDEEKAQMDFEEKVVNIISISILVGFVAIVILAIRSGFVVF